MKKASRLVALALGGLVTLGGIVGCGREQNAPADYYSRTIDLYGTIKHVGRITPKYIELNTYLDPKDMENKELDLGYPDQGKFYWVRLNTRKFGTPPRLQPGDEIKFELGFEDLAHRGIDSNGSPIYKIIHHPARGVLEEYRPIEGGLSRPSNPFR